MACSEIVYCCTLHTKIVRGELHTFPARVGFVLVCDALKSLDCQRPFASVHVGLEGVHGQGGGDLINVRSDMLRNYYELIIEAGLLNQIVQTELSQTRISE